MSGMITDLPLMGSPPILDTDVIEIVDVGGNASYKTTVYNLLGLTGGNPVSTTDSQAITNKTFDQTNIYYAQDGNDFILFNAADNTKSGKFSLSGLTTGATRTLSWPDADGTLVCEDTTQTLTNKTISGGTVDNATVTVDEVAGHTSAHDGTIYGAAVVSGILQASALVGDASYASANYVPTITNFTTGNGAVGGAYNQIGKMVFYRANFTFGSTSAVAGAVTISLPVTSISYSANRHQIGYGIAYDDSATTAYKLAVVWATTTTATVWAVNAASTNSLLSALSSTVPITWATSDTMQVELIYEAA